MNLQIFRLGLEQGWGRAKMMRRSFDGSGRLDPEGGGRALQVGGIYWTFDSTPMKKNLYKQEGQLERFPRGKKF